MGHAIASVTWNPLVQQAADDDTTWLLDVAVEQADWTADGRLIDWSGRNTSSAACNPWRAGSQITTDDGKFTTGIRGGSTASSYLIMQDEHLPPASFTVEFWVRCDDDWSTIGSAYLYLMSFAKPRSDNTTEGSSLSFYVRTGKLHAYYRHHQNGDQTATIQSSITPLADEWIGVFLTYDGSTLALRTARNDTLATAGTATVLPAVSWCNADANGFALLAGRLDGVDPLASAWTVSDIRISRVCRIPSTPVTVGPNTVTITDTVAGTIPQNMRGMVHYFGADETERAGDNLITADAFTVGRTDKLISATPIKAGAVDGTHPSLGHSGLYSYDWRVVDHTMDYYADRGILPYVGLDSTPHILGGQSQPFSGAQLTNENVLSGDASFNIQVPNDFDAFATIAADVYYYIKHTRQDDVFTWGFWNEPTGFWLGTELQHNQLFKAVTDKIQLIDADVSMGGPEEDEYLPSLIAYCGANNVDLDHVSTHFYSNDPGEITQQRETIDAALTSAGLTGTKVYNGEWNISQSIKHGGQYPASDLGRYWSSYAASLNAALLIEMTRNGFECATRYAAVRSSTSSTGNPSMGCWDTGKAWAPLNVQRIWKLLG